MSSFLPPEIVTDILSRLPVKPLLRFRCVSKPWCCLIDSPDFVKLHLNKSLNAKSNRNLLLGFKDFSVHSVELRSLDSPGFDSIESTQRLKPLFLDYNVVMNSCNGLTLVRSARILEDKLQYIWNPFTRKYLELPPIPFPSCDPFDINCQGLPIPGLVEYGFAYVSETDDYKVVLVKDIIGFDFVYSGNEACIFSTKSNKWEMLEPFPYQISCKWRVWGSAHLNGSLHTLVEKGEHVQWVLMVFDTRSKHHSMLPTPTFASKSDVVVVEVLQGNLCLLHERPKNSGGIHLDIWVMKDYGVEDSWFKLLSVSLQPHSYPLAYSDDGDKVLIIYKRKRLIWYNLRDKSVRRIKVNVLPLEFHAEVSFETLVSLPGFISVDKPSQTHKGNANTCLTKGFLSEGFKLKL